MGCGGGEQIENEAMGKVAYLDTQLCCGNSLFLVWEGPNMMIASEGAGGS